LTYLSLNADNVGMQSEFWNNVRKQIKVKKDGQKWLSEASKVGRTVINSGIARLSSPSVDNAYKVAKALETTVEELVDCEAGEEYVRKIFADKGLLWEPPPRIADIVGVLDSLDNATLDFIRKMVVPLGGKRV